VKTLAVIGAGSWGTALASVLAQRFERVRLWAYEPDLGSRIQETRQNEIYLPDIILPTNVEATSTLPLVLRDAEVVLTAVPSNFLRSIAERMAALLQPEIILVSATKGIENGTLLRPSEILTEVFSTEFPPRVAVLSGPSFAREVASLSPTAMVVAAGDSTVARCVQSAFSGQTFRLYTSSDPIGVEIGGSIKNVVAIGAGVVEALHLGHNAMAALITRGLAEITRLAVALGGLPQTLAGLAGLGDLVLTCTGELSRNRSVGMELGRGRPLSEIVSSTRMVAEGVKTTAAARELAKKLGVEMPITEQMYQMLHFGLSPRDALRNLMERSLRGE
jgi:glycerol-3-phosphate dehydrogenase (NAD(P)+)